MQAQSKFSAMILVLVLVSVLGTTAPSSARAGQQKVSLSDRSIKTLLEINNIDIETIWNTYLDGTLTAVEENELLHAADVKDSSLISPATQAKIEKALNSIKGEILAKDSIHPKIRNAIANYFSYHKSFVPRIENSQGDEYILDVPSLPLTININNTSKNKSDSPHFTVSGFYRESQSTDEFKGHELERFSPEEHCLQERLVDPNFSSAVATIDRMWKFDKKGSKAVVDTIFNPDYSLGRSSRSDNTFTNLRHAISLRAKGKISLDDMVMSHTPTKNNSVKLLLDSEEILSETFFPLVASAKESIHMMMYQFRDGRLGESFVNALLEACSRGVDVYVLTDSEGSAQMPYSSAKANLERFRSGCVEKTADGKIKQRGHLSILPFARHGTQHQKAIIVDSEVAVIGSTNLHPDSLESENFRPLYKEVMDKGNALKVFKNQNAVAPSAISSDNRSSFDPKDRATHDFMVKISGDAVPQMQTEFVLNWLKNGDPLYPEISNTKLFKKLSQPYAKREKLDPYLSTAVAATNPDAGMKCEESCPQCLKIAQGVGYRKHEWLEIALDLIKNARESVMIEAAYITSPQVQDALIDTAKRLRALKIARGEKFDPSVNPVVTIIVPGYSDHFHTSDAMRNVYQKFLDAGVKLAEYQGFTHGKSLIIDNKITSIGSADFMGFTHCYELVSYILGEDFAKKAKEKIFDRDLEATQSVHVDEDFVKNLPLTIKLRSPLMRWLYSIFAHNV
ncbi:MAG: phosphatidylserine/phosphatidylglycerophosphate/cardiolipin synthase family protein [Oligoflexia bacterium]|nr:phosphatidylserine/phosphatidylglycerophosphate/cardiolipin synthase family protein [Oligoflexia bacterium]